MIKEINFILKEIKENNIFREKKIVMVLTYFVTGPKRHHLLYNKVISVLKKT